MRGGETFRRNSGPPLLSSPLLSSPLLSSPLRSARLLRSALVPMHSKHASNSPNSCSFRTCTYASDVRIFFHSFGFLLPDLTNPVLFPLCWIWLWAFPLLCAGPLPSTITVVNRVLVRHILGRGRLREARNRDLRLGVLGRRR